MKHDRQCNVGSRNQSCHRNVTMCSLCIVDIHIAVNNVILKGLP